MLFILLAVGTMTAGPGTHDCPPLHDHRSSPQDLAVSGDLPGLKTGEVRFVAYQDLLKLPQVSFAATGDANFASSPQIRGVSLEELIHSLGLPKSGELVAAICNDSYEAHYTAEYRSEHHPAVALSIGGQAPSAWPRINGRSYGPYLISHAGFTPSFHILSHTDEPQIPYGVLELKFLREDLVLNALLPPGKHAANSPVMQGYQIAFQNCFRCHNRGSFGGLKAGRSWEILGEDAAKNPSFFEAFIRNGDGVGRDALMPGNPEYDSETLHALTLYFQTFAPHRAP